jgi:hypothetical protein
MVLAADRYERRSLALTANQPSRWYIPSAGRSSEFSVGNEAQHGQAGKDVFNMTLETY